MTDTQSVDPPAVERWDEPIPGGTAHHDSFPERGSFINALGGVEEGAYVDVRYIAAPGSAEASHALNGATWIGFGIEEHAQTKVILRAQGERHYKIVPVERLLSVIVKKIEVFSYECTK